jgi:peptidoglycan/LPS O-acetylase OafA/YrhL
MSAHARLPGLDGLRGVAVLAVIGYHLNLGHFLPAGFLGVDIFFTVSGFIITALLLQEHAQTGRIDFKAFYLRRARRLFPAALALLLVLVALTPLLLPAALVRLREDLPAAFLYASNWWQIVAQQSYFEAMDQPRLLQHLWSLAIEEQYYLLWPLAALGLLQRGSRTGLGVAAGLLAIASTGWMAWLYAMHIDGGDPSRVYLGTDTHWMGLLAGSALAAWWNPWKIRLASPAGDEVLNLAGTAALAGLVWSMAEIHEGMRGLYQGGFLWVAVLTCAVIAAATREGTWVDWMLSTRPMRWLGARSYSLYLWHWPVVVWLQPAPQAQALELAGVTAVRLALTLVCAEASYRWVETRWTAGLATMPWRRGTAMACTALLLVDAGVLAFLPGTVPDRPPVPAVAEPWHKPHQPSPSKTPYPSITLVGDSVLLGARPYLLRRLPWASVEAKVGRQGGEGLKLVQSLRDTAQLGDAAVIHLGTMYLRSTISGLAGATGRPQGGGGGQCVRGTPLDPAQQRDDGAGECPFSERAPGGLARHRRSQPGLFCARRHPPVGHWHPCLLQPDPHGLGSARGGGLGPDTPANQAPATAQAVATAGCIARHRCAHGIARRQRSHGHNRPCTCCTDDFNPVRVEISSRQPFGAVQFSVG